ncbi:MAG TPA: transglutaminase-like domain-containing protein [Gemmatimonadaceae bacterium]|nr:transglutaminase-like domain-containing protein [Gemmatimonadaceae bacterium]
MIRRRAVIGVLVIAAWLGGLALLVRREYFRPELERLAEAALRVNPGAVFYGVMQGNRQIGFASSTIDTAQSTITVADYFVADLPVGGKARRATARTNVTLSRALRVRDFDLALETEGPPIRATGRVDGDSTLVLAITSGTAKPDTQRIALSGPILLPTLVPLAVALGEQPKVGKRYVLPIFDPASMAPKDMGVDVRAESLFVLDDSSAYDSTTGRWHGVLPDTIHAWQVSSEGSGGFSGWIDEQGRIVETTQLGLALRRLPYEVAFENWRSDTSTLAVPSTRDILETTAIAANKRMDGRVDSLALRLSGVDLTGFDLPGQRQHLRHDTLSISPIAARTMDAPYDLPSMTMRAYTRPEPLLQSTDPRIRALARTIVGNERDPRIVAERLNRWVHDSIAPRITFGVPSAVQVLRTRAGDCNEHTQLYVALARAVGLPARIAAGLAYVDGKFYYHAWPEVLLRDWVAVDPTFGQFPADAAHLRFVVGGLTRQTELLRLMGSLRIDVLSERGESSPAAR